MSSIKCPSCGLVNFPGSDRCRRCKQLLPTLWELQRPTVTPAPSAISRGPKRRERSDGAKVALSLIGAAGVAAFFAQSRGGEVQHWTSIGLVLLGFVVIFVGTILLWLAAFQVGVAWGLLCLIPGCSLIFLVVHWHAAKTPVGIQGLGALFLLAGALIA